MQIPVDLKELKKKIKEQGTLPEELFDDIALGIWARANNFVPKKEIRLFGDVITYEMLVETKKKHDAENKERFDPLRPSVESMRRFKDMLPIQDNLALDNIWLLKQFNVEKDAQRTK